MGQQVVATASGCRGAGVKFWPHMPFGDHFHGCRVPQIGADLAASSYREKWNPELLSAWGPGEHAQRWMSLNPGTLGLLIPHP